MGMDPVVHPNLCESDRLWHQRQFVDADWAHTNQDQGQGCHEPLLGQVNGMGADVTHGSGAMIELRSP